MRFAIKYFTSILLFVISIPAIHSQTGTATVKGRITTVFGDPVANVSISYDDKGSISNDDGYYTIEIPAGKKIYLRFSHVSFVDMTIPVQLPPGGTKILHVEIQEKVEEIDSITIQAHKENAGGITHINVETVKAIPSTSNSLKEVITGMALGASSDNELSTQYKVRGGNYDENLVYVNGIEVYRPFLIRSGQQEGLSFVNTDMTGNVKFSSGGFQAKYGDKLSSVLDIRYRQPETFGLRVDMSMTGASVTTDIAGDKTGMILGLRYHNNSLLVNSKDINANYNPRFTDMQLFVNKKLNSHTGVRFLGNFASNNYLYIPTTRRTKFGSLLDPKELYVYYEGRENDKYLTGFGALQLKYVPNEKTDFDLTASLFNTKEEEYFDILASYALGTPNTDASATDYGESVIEEEIGAQLNHARNDLDALIGNIKIRYQYRTGKHQIITGLGYQYENIRDRLIEWEVIDSAGFSVRPPGHEPNLEPYEPFEGPLTPYQDLRGNHTTDISRITGFIQWNHRIRKNEHIIRMNAGVRTHTWTIEGNSQTVVSPRAQISLKPAWTRDVIFRLSGGLYAQPPMYRELRDFDGILHPGVKAQKSWHLVVGGDYSFDMWNRPFKLTAEAYYKYLTDVNPYNLDNVRIRYAAHNDATAYATGLDMRINGEFVPGTESWFNFGYLKTEENIQGKGYIPRPTDQRLKFALLFQDYVPSIPKLKMYMNLIYNTGVPGGSPAYSDPYDYQSRLGDYRRVDIGIFYIFKDRKNASRAHWLHSFKEFSIGGEIFNMFDIPNAITNTWVRDVYSKRMYAVKNYMTGRVFNLRIKCKL